MLCEDNRAVICITRTKRAIMSVIVFLQKSVLKIINIKSWYPETITPESKLKVPKRR